MESEKKSIKLHNWMNTISLMDKLMIDLKWSWPLAGPCPS